MKASIAEQVRYFDELACRRFWLGFSSREEEILERLFQSWRIAPGERLLEPGCGAGRLTPRLAEAVGPRGRVIACDISCAMLRLAAQRRLPPQAGLLSCSALSLPFPEHSFDRIICLNAFPHFVPLTRALQELARVLDPGGRVHIAHFQCAAGTNEIHAAGAPAIRDHLVPSIEALRELFETAGVALVHGHDSEERGYSATGVKRPGK